MVFWMTEKREVWAGRPEHSQSPKVRVLVGQDKQVDKARGLSKKTRYTVVYTGKYTSLPFPPPFSSLLLPPHSSSSASVLPSCCVCWVTARREEDLKKTNKQQKLLCMQCRYACRAPSFFVNRWVFRCFAGNIQAHGWELI